MGKDRDMIIDVVEGSDIVEEKIRRLPAGTETWDRKMKRKRSMSAVSTRPIDGDAKPKQVVHHKFKNESALRSSNVHDFRYVCLFFGAMMSSVSNLLMGYLLLFMNGNGI